MRVHILAYGRIGRGPEADLVQRYLARIAWPVTVTELGEAGAMPPAPAAARTVLLDERGEDLTSEALAGRLAHWRDGGVRDLRFLVGAADGFDAAARRSADLVLAFGRATWPHLLARAMLAEQIYRAFTILHHHPYHRR